MRVLGAAVATRVDLQPPLYPVHLKGTGVDDGLGQLGVVLEDVGKLIVLGHQLMSKITCMIYMVSKVYDSS